MSSLIFRHPTPADGARLWRLVRATEALDDNSCYAYLLLCKDFADTCLLAESDGALAGFITGYAPPGRSDTLFIWQVAVAASWRRQGVGGQLLRRLADLRRRRGARFVEATVSPSNTASARLFAAAAQAWEAPLRIEPGFASGDFAGAAHEREDLFRIGPLSQREADENF